MWTIATLNVVVDGTVILGRIEPMDPCEGREGQSQRVDGQMLVLMNAPLLIVYSLVKTTPLQLFSRHLLSQHTTTAFHHV